MDETVRGLRAAGVSLGYGGDPVVHDVDVALRPGRVTALVGPNGSGKSTLLRSLARLHPLASGTVLLDGRDLSALGRRDLATRLAMLAQHRPVPGGITVAEAVAFGRHPHRTGLFGRDPEGPDAVARAIEATELTDLADRGVDELSGGQVQRVWLASCLAQHAPVLLLDEPTNHLDMRHQVALLRLVRELADRDATAVGVVLHDLEQAAAIADEVVLLDHGHVVASGAPSTVLTSEHLGRAYGVPVDVEQTSSGLRISALAAIRRPEPTATPHETERQKESR